MKWENSFLADISFNSSDRTVFLRHKQKPFARESQYWVSLMSLNHWSLVVFGSLNKQRPL